MKTGYWQITYKEQTAGISGFPGRPIDESMRWEAYVAGVGTKLFPSFDEAMAWAASASGFARESARIDAFGQPYAVYDSKGNRSDLVCKSQEDERHADFHATSDEPCAECSPKLK